MAMEKVKKYISQKGGFTLVELLVVIAVIGILASATIIIINPAQQFKKARDTKRKSDLEVIRASLELYKADNGTYPITSDWVISESANPWIPGLSSSYIKNLPKDPKNTGGNPITSGNYEYGYYSATWCSASPGVSYILTARLENAADSQAGNYIEYGSSPCSWGGAGLYTVTSP